MPVALSIIIPTFNSERTIHLSLESICNQTWKNFEIIIMDNCSTDNTIVIVESFKDKHPHISIQSEKDKGIYDAMNKGIAKAKGEWIYFLGSDDTIFKNDTLQKVFSKNIIADVMYGNVVSTYFEGEYAGEFSIEKLYHQNICHQAIFFRKTLFEKIGTYNTNYKILADWEHNIRWFCNKNIVKQYIPYIIANYAADGFSKKNVDLNFKNDKDLLFFQNGKKELATHQKKQILKQITYESYTKKQYLKTLFYYLYYLCQ